MNLRLRIMAGSPAIRKLEDSFGASRFPPNHGIMAHPKGILPRSCGRHREVLLVQHRARYPALLKTLFQLQLAREAQRGKISLSAPSILSTSSRITLIDCWFFDGWANGVIPSRAFRI